MVSRKASASSPRCSTKRRIALSETHVATLGMDGVEEGLMDLVEDVHLDRSVIDPCVQGPEIVERGWHVA
jgi:hypothetical protein